MKAYLVLCILLASVLFFPSSLLARELAAGGKVTPVTRDPNAKPCGPGGKGKSYNCNLPKRPPKSGPSCNKFERRGCVPNSSP